MDGIGLTDRSGGESMEHTYIYYQSQRILENRD